MENRLKMHGNLLENAWKPSGKFLETPKKMHGNPPKNAWKPLENVYKNLKIQKKSESSNIGAELQGLHADAESVKHCV